MQIFRMVRRGPNETTVLDYLVPDDKADGFLVAVDEAARAAGAEPVEEVSWTSDEVTEASVVRRWLDERQDLVAEAEEMLNGSDDCSQA